jgi:hypothetical protein
MKNVIAIAASLLVNLSLIAAFERSANEAVPLPNGEVIVTDLNLEAVSSLAQTPIAGIDAG